MAEREHTPTPWKLDPRMRGAVFAADRIGLKVAATKPGHVFPIRIDQEADANAAFIVCACNAHDDLVAALKEARDTIAFIDGDSGHADEIVAKIDAALAKASPVEGA